MPRSHLRIIALGVLCAILAVVFADYVAVMGSFALAFALCFVWWLFEYVKWKRANRYDLGALTRLHLAESDPESEMDEFSDVYCFACSRPYDPKYPRCPHCGAPPGPGCC